MNKQSLLLHSMTSLVYFSFVILCLVVIVIFVTANTYIQLSIAILFYILLAFFAYKILPHSWKYGSKKPVTDTQLPLEEVSSRLAKPVEKTEGTQRSNLGISDINKRAFLKIIGATGLSFFLISIFGQRVESLLFGRQSSGPTSTSNFGVGTTNAAPASPTDGYSISEVDDNIVSYYGFINTDGGWFIMKGDTNTGSFRYVKGKSNFPLNWNNREHLKYDYFYEVFSQN